MSFTNNLEVVTVSITYTGHALRYSIRFSFRNPSTRDTSYNPESRVNRTNLIFKLCLHPVAPFNPKRVSNPTIHSYTINISLRLRCFSSEMKISSSLRYFTLRASSSRKRVALARVGDVAPKGDTSSPSLPLSLSLILQLSLLTLSAFLSRLRLRAEISRILPRSSLRSTLVESPRSDSSLPPLPQLPARFARSLRSASLRFSFLSKYFKHTTKPTSYERNT